MPRNIVIRDKQCRIKRTFRYIFIMTALLFLLTACSQVPNGQTSDNNAPNVPAENNEQTAPEKENNEEQLPELRYVDEDELDGSLRLFVDDNVKHPGIYFFTEDEEVYILATWGEKPTGGYTLEITGLEASDEGDYQLIIERTSPESDDMVTQAVTTPHQVVAVKARGSLFTVRYTGDEVAGEDERMPREGIVGPNLIVETPAVGETIGDKLQLSGRARVFEASFEVVLEDGHNQLFKGPITADQGAPEWGRFDEEIAYEETSQQHGLLILTEYSMRDGTPREIVITSVKFPQ